MVVDNTYFGWYNLVMVLYGYGIICNWYVMGMDEYGFGIKWQWYVLDMDEYGKWV